MGFNSWIRNIKKYFGGYEPLANEPKESKKTAKASSKKVVQDTAATAPTKRQVSAETRAKLSVAAKAAHAKRVAPKAPATTKPAAASSSKETVKSAATATPKVESKQAATK